MADVNQEAVLSDFNSNWFTQTEANDGGGFTRHPWGDYRLRVKDFTIEASKGTNPHNMMVVTYETIALAGDGDQAAIGMTQVARYGTPQSPKFMQQRAKQFLTAIGVAGPFSPKAILGRELDATVTWEKSAPVLNEAGEEKVYVNSRVGFERKAGSAKPPKANARAASAAAAKYLEGQGEDTAPAAEGTAAAHAPAWEAATQPAATTAPAQAATQWIPEAQVIPAAHQYRVIIAMGKPQADVARRSLIDKRINPEGEVNLDHVPEPLRAEFIAWKAKQGGDGGLPDLDGGGNGAATAPKPARTGTRTPRQPAA